MKYEIIFSDIKMTAKICTNCEILLELEEFNVDKRSIDGRTSCCGNCLNKLARNKHAKDHNIIKNANFRRRYGIDLECYNRMFAENGGCCGSCKTHQSELSRPLCVDHDHTTGKVRGLLCFLCNLMLGHAKDSIERLEYGINYLKTHQSDN